MRHLINRLSLLSQRDFQRSHQNSIIRILALAATTTGAGLFWAKNRDENAREHWSSALRTMQDVYPIIHMFSSSLASSSGHIPLVFSRIAYASVPSPEVSKEAIGDSASVPLPDVSKEAIGDSASVPSPDISKEAIGDSGKCCPGCLGRDSISTAAAMVGPAVVNLSITQDFYGMALRKRIASGTIIGSDGTILTCAHAVVDFQSMRSVSKGKVDVTLLDGRTFEGTVVNADFHSDIAVVKINSKTPLPTAKLGSSSKILPGDWVVAMGCPLSLQNTVTAGIVSCVDRKSSDLGLGGMRREYLQTDCAINGGNSGGPLVNLNGEVVGVNIMKIAAANGLSFAVPIDSVTKIIEHFKKNGRVVRPWLGLKMLDLNELIISQLKERDITFPNVTKGVLVPMVTPGSPAGRAGFRPGDVVIEFDAKPVESIKEIIEIMGDNVGKPFKVVVKRSKEKLVTLTVVPEEVNSGRARILDLRGRKGKAQEVSL